jgi:hypothetical protein
MRAPTLPNRRAAAAAASAMVLALFVAGCGKSPTAPPEQAAGPDSLEVTVTFETILAVADGDGVEGAGDFDFAMRVTKGSDTYYHATNEVHLNTGEVLTLNRRKIFRFPVTAAEAIDFAIVATEWDQDIFGNIFPDSDLSGADKVFEVPFDYNPGLLKHRLGNSNCMVEYRIRVTSRAI